MIYCGQKTVPKRQKFLENSWWRHSAYEVRARCIAPASGAELNHYDPLRTKPGRAEGEISQALDDLLELFPFKGEFTVSGRAVLEWSRKYGPLGILLHQTMLVRFPPQPVVAEDRSAIEILAERQRIPYVEFSKQLSGRKVTEFRFQGGWHKSEQFLLAHDGENADPSAYAVLRIERESREMLVTERIGRAWGPFFPTVPAEERESHAYPAPGSTDFAEAYCEPFEEFLQWGRELSTAVALLQLTNNVERWTQGAAALSWLAAAVSPVLRLDSRKRAQLTWRSPSLIGSLALEAMQRMAASRRVRMCKDPQCGRLFIPTNARAEYHDNTCRWRHHKEIERATSKPQRSDTKGRRGERKST